VREYPPPQPTRGSGERRKLPQRGPGREVPAVNGFWCILSLKNESGDDKFDIFFCHFHSAYLESNLQC